MAENEEKSIACKSAHTLEIEVTDAMIEAGAEALLGLYTLNHDFSPGEALDLAERVLRAALEAPRSESPEDH